MLGPMDGRYRFVQRLGGGGMAEVYLAYAVGAEGFEKPVAIKRMLPHLARDAQVGKMFIAEAKVATHLHHQNIVEVFDVGRANDGLFLVMELVDGWDLGIVLDASDPQRPALPEPLAAFVAAQVVAGLSHAYRKVIDGKPLLTAHRDISPSNILMTVDGEVKVGDFGIAKVESAQTGTTPGTFKGKVPYASPEMVRGVEASHLSDQFSLGIVLHEMLTGALPYGRFENLVLYSEALAKGQPPAMQGVHPQLAAIVRRMLALQPQARYPNIEQVGRALNAYLAAAQIPASSSELASFLATLRLPDRPTQLLAQPSLQGQSDAIDGSERTFVRIPSAPIKLAQELPSEIALQSSRQPITLQEAPSDAAPLELDPNRTHWRGRPTVSAPAEEEPRGGRWLPRALGVFALLAAIAIGAAVAFPRLVPGLTRPIAMGPDPGPPTAVLHIDSVPQGATVRINGQVVGETPLAIENVYPAVDIPVQVSLNGYRSWKGKFKGGQESRVEAKLER